jgi:predicted peptidase
MKKTLIFFLLLSHFCSAQKSSSKISSFTLINAETDLPIRTITNGSVINLDVDGYKLNIRANTSPSSVSRVDFVLSGTQNNSTADIKNPFSLFGDANGNYSIWAPAVGNYTLKATPLFKNRLGSSATISFTVTKNVALPNKAPVANAGTDKIISLPANSVTLSGSGTDTDGTIASYQWTKIGGPSQYTIANAGSASTAINNLAQGVYAFRLMVTDNGGLTAADTVLVTVNAAIQTNKAPTANAGTDKTITLPTNSVSLTGSGTDTDGTIASYQWTKISGPTQFTIASPANASTAINNLAQGVYSFRLLVTDNGGLTAADTVLVTVNAAIQTNKAPTANAGTDKTITLPVNSVSLTGSGTDTDGTIASYLWTKISGPAQFTIASPANASTAINNLAQGVYSFRLLVTDNGGLTGADTVLVTVNAATQVDTTNRGGYYASPTGTGNGTYSSPFRIADFWKVAKPGDTLNLLNGVYTGASSMITPPENLSGTSSQRIVVRAVNDGKVDIDGQGLNAPVRLSYNNYFTIEGVNAHNAGSPTSINVSVVNVSYSSNNILRRICAWEAADGNTNVFGVHHGNYNLLEDCAAWGTARKTFSNSQQGNYTTFRRCFGRWEGSHAEGPKKTFGVSYNSYNALLENCIGTWDALKMQQSYELHDYFSVGVGKFYSNYEVQQPDGIYSHDGFDVLPDVANARIYGSIAYIKASQRYTNSAKKWAAPFAFEIKGVDINNCLSYIEPGSKTDNWNVNLASVGNTTTNKVKGLTQIGGELGHISSDWTPQNMVASATCNGINTGTVVTKKYIDGVITNEDLWPWPMNQRIIDAMTQAGYPADKIIDVNKDVFGLCGNTPPTVDIVTVAKQWLTDSTSRASLSTVLDSWTGNIDSVIQKVKPAPVSTQKGQVFYQSFNNPLFQKRYPDHKYHMYIPSHYSSSSPMGVMIWLHGGGSWDPTEIDHLAIYDMDNEQVTGRSYPRVETDNSNYILVAPLAPFGSVIPHPSHASRWNVPNAEQYLIDIITEISTRYNIDYNRIVVAGFSMGGIGAYHMSQRLNDRLAAVMASAGSWKVGTWDGLKNMPMYLIQGVNDAHYNSSGCRAHFTAIEYARVAHNFLYKSSPIHKLYEYPGQHPWDESGYLYWKNFLSSQQGWVTDKVRNPYRSNVTAVNPWRSYEVGSNYGVTWYENPSPHSLWVTIKQTGTGTIPYDYARVEGTGGCTSLADFNNWALYGETKNLPGGKAEVNITGPNQITVTSSNVTKMSLWLHPSMVDFSKPVTVILNGVSKTYNLKPSLLKALQSYERRWDWGMIYHTEIDIL